MPKDPNDEKNVLARNPRRHRRRRSGALRRRPVPDVHALRRASGLEARRDVEQREPAAAASRKPSSSIEGKRRLQPAEVRERRASRAARAGHRSQRPHPHVDRHGRGAARGGGSRHPDQREGPAHRHVLLERPGRPERQHDLLGRAHHAHSHRPRRLAAGREVADQEPREGDEGAARASLRDGDAEAAGRDREGAARPGRHAASAPRRSAPTTSRRAASPITASTSRPTSCTTCSKAT